MAKETGTTMAVVSCAVHYLINQTKEIVEPAPLMEHAYASSDMQISYVLFSVQTTMFVSFFFFKCTARKTSSFSG